MKFIIDHYFLISMVIGFLHFCISGMNIILKFTEIPIFKGFFKDETPNDIFYNLFVLGFLSFMFSLVWPVTLTFLIIYLIVYCSLKS